jgi:Uma2 family endonuclease
MSTVTETFTVPRNLAEHHALGEDTGGVRRELIDGTLVVSSAPRARHGLASARLTHLLTLACPSDLVVLGSPINVDEEPATNLQPDISVIRLEWVDTLRPSEMRPLLVVEVLSPSSRRIDRLLKRDIYQRMGIASYWIVDPDEPGLVVLELVNGSCVEVARAAGDESVRVERPFPVVISPSAWR